jgi:hypothetical protein
MEMCSHLCDVKLGWHSRFWGDWLILTHSDYSPYYIKICDIVRGETLPRDR